MMRRPPNSPLFPYHDALPISRQMIGAGMGIGVTTAAAGAAPGDGPALRLLPLTDHWRSEEQTPELQSRQYLVCRLLLEKKQNISILPSLLHISPSFLFPCPLP